MTIPAGTVQQQLRAALRDGKTPEQATAAVMGPYGQVLREAGNDSLVGYARPAVLAEARRLDSQMQRKARDRAFQAPPASRERERLRELSFHLHDGTVVSWAQATREQHEARIAWLQTYISTVEQDLRRHERILKLLVEQDAERLADIDGWEALVGDDLDDAEEGEDASGEDVP